MNQFLERAMKLKEVTIRDRRYLHEHAEAGRSLPNTTKYIKDRLKEIGLDPEEICDSGVVATLKGKYPGKTILLRCDTDALPMAEENELSYQSKTKAAHTCGHDIHTAMLLSAAEILNERKEEIHGNVKFMFQPAEEVFDGAEKMIAAGVLENPKVDVAMGLHTMLDMEAPSVGYSAGNMTSSCDGFKITIYGNGCHGATPHMGIDPINAGVHLYLAFQQLIAREVPPMESVSLTFGEFSAGSSCNIIPQECILQGTLRTYSAKVREHIVTRMKDITNALEEMFKVKVKYEVLSGVPSTYTDPVLLKELLHYVKELDCDMKFISNYKVTPSDDFAFVSQSVPTVYFMLGCKERDCSYSHHNPKVVFDETAMVYGVGMHAQCAFDWLNNQ